MCISRATVSAVSCLVVPAFICIDLLISLVLKIKWWWWWNAKVKELLKSTVCNCCRSYCKESYTFLWTRVYVNNESTLRIKSLQFWRWNLHMTAGSIMDRRMWVFSGIQLWYDACWRCRVWLASTRRVQCPPYCYSARFCSLYSCSVFPPTGPGYHACPAVTVRNLN